MPLLDTAKNEEWVQFPVRVGFSYNAEMMVETLTFALCGGE
ncbi:hypothetical protein [Pseudomonas sp. 28 E 9]|jgi:hypothetical protein|nr:hypothetical protein [Pseudomonas sp. 28 E 9]